MDATDEVVLLPLTGEAALKRVEQLCAWCPPDAVRSAVRVGVKSGAGEYPDPDCRGWWDSVEADNVHELLSLVPLLVEQIRVLTRE